MLVSSEEELFEYDAEGWRTRRVERELHPTRAHYKRIAGRILIWVPSGIAALVLFFFPVLSHLRHPQAQYLTHYRVAVPWNFTIWRATLAQVPDRVWH